MSIFDIWGLIPSSLKAYVNARNDGHTHEYSLQHCVMSRYFPNVAEGQGFWFAWTEKKEEFKDVLTNAGYKPKTKEEAELKTLIYLLFTSETNKEFFYKNGLKFFQRLDSEYSKFQKRYINIL